MDLAAQRHEQEACVEVEQAGELFTAQRARLFGLAYRLTGSAADAEDCVQEAFARWLADRDHARAAGGPWLVRVVTNLSLDLLRRRRRRAYPGPWLPAPLEDAGDPEAPERADPAADPESRYGLLESASYAFLLALEALGPRQRAALILGDVLGCSAAEVAAALDTSAGNARVLQLRARRALASYDQARCIPGPELRKRYRGAAERFVRCLAARDAAGLEALLAESVHTTTDAGGEYTALASTLAGRRRVARFYLRAAQHREGSQPRVRIAIANGLPAVSIELRSPVRRQAPRSLLCFALDAEGRIESIHTILATRKLAGLRAREA